jgi:hypothetical protein
LKPDREKWFEVFAVLITGLLKFVMMDWLDMRAVYIVTICLFWLIFVYIRYKGDHSVLQHWGIRKQNFRQSFLFLLPFTVICTTGIGIYGYLSGAYLLNWHFIPIFLLYPLWGLIQQFMMTGLISGNLKAIRNPGFKNYQIILVTSLLFSLVHYPSEFLMIFTFFMQCIFTATFLRWKNLWPLGLYHGWMATFLLFYVLGRDLWVELFAGF